MPTNDGLRVTQSRGDVGGDGRAAEVTLLAGQPLGGEGRSLAVLSVSAASPEQAARAIAALTLPPTVERAIAEDIERCATLGGAITAECAYTSDSDANVRLRYRVERLEDGEHVQVRVDDVSAEPPSAPARPAPAELLALTLDAAEGCFYVKDVHGRYLHVNQRLAALYGRTPEEIVGRTDADLFPPAEARRLRAMDERALEAGHRLQVEETLPGAPDRVFLSTRQPLLDEAGCAVGVCNLAVDLTDRLRSATVLSRSTERIMQLNACFLSFGPEPEENMRRLVTLSRDLLGGACALYKRVGDGMLSSWGLWSAPSDEGLAGRTEGQLCNEVLAADGDGIVVIRNLDGSHYATTDPNVRQYGLQTYVGHPVRLAGRSLGALCVVYQQDYVPTDEDRRLMGIIASALAVEERRQRAEERQSVAYGIAEAASKATSLYDLSGYIQQELSRVLDARNFYIALDDREAGRITFPYYVDEVVAPGVEGRAGRAYGMGLTEYLLRSGEPQLLCEDDIRALLRQGAVRDIGPIPRVWLGVPLVDKGETIGAMVVQSYATAEAYDHEDREFLGFVSNQVAAAIKSKRANDALLESESRYRLLAENVSDIIWVRDADLRLVYISGAVERVLGYSVHEALGQTLEEALAPSSAQALREAVPQMRARFEAGDEELTLELEHNRRDGSTIWAEVKMTFLPAEDGQPPRILGVTRDITQRRELERQFRQVNKMESLGQLAGGIAHHFNNLLTVINGYSQFMLASLGEGDPLRHDAESILKAGKRAAELTRQLLDFSRRRVLNPTVVDLNTLLPRTAEMLGSLLGENIHLRLRLCEGLPCVRADAAQIEQVVLNLVLNARDAMPDGGILTISTGITEEDVATARPGHRAQRYVILSVQDTGTGMTPEVREHLFEPFFTTKEIGEGTGLGLATVYGIVTQVGGRIDVETEEGRGSTFRVLLPAVDERPPAPASAPAPESAPVGRELLLVLEDEQEVRDLAVRMLERLGYTVLAAPNGRIGLQTAFGHPRPVDLVLADVMLPEMRAVDFMRRMRDRFPRVKVLYMSGYSDGSVLPPELEGEEGAPFIGKPFALNTLAQAVRDVLDGEDGAE